MRLKDGYITHTDGREHITVGAGTEFNGLIKSNATAAYIIESLKSETTEERVVERVLSEYDAPRDAVREDVRMVLDTLNGVGALEL